jgi:aspartyl-tRNA(Asn)/glutamyl-tRNA(Gln) amidotransferase subunit A
MMGTYVLSAGFHDAYYSQAKKVQQLIREDFAKVFEEVDVLVTPTSPTVAFKLGERQDPLKMHLADVCTVAVNVAGLPALSLPCGEADGLPVGLQVIGKWWEEGKILRVGHQLEKVL